MIITNDQKLSHKCHPGLDPESKTSKKDAEINSARLIQAFEISSFLFR